MSYQSLVESNSIITKVFKEPIVAWLEVYNKGEQRSNSLKAYLRNMLSARMVRAAASTGLLALTEDRLLYSTVGDEGDIHTSRTFDRSSIEEFKVVKEKSQYVRQVAFTYEGKEIGFEVHTYPSMFKNFFGLKPEATDSEEFVAMANYLIDQLKG